ncbi:MAG TPA: serine/threonine-protein kinase [Pyrinomonadaceae bacterium]|nr:serine/threonine-protein kinase [Pyrinomonadaceae bacterium]
MFLQGQTIGPYTLISRLGKGGFGDVWLAEKRSQFLSKRVALKLPHDDQVDLKTIEREAQLWEAASGHPNVLPIIDAEVYDGQVVIVSEYADGGSLADKLKGVGAISHKQAAEIVIGILNGLEFLHNRQIIHRDIKPQNILLQGDTPRLADFGISRAMQTTAVSSTIIGTDAYMSPEAFDGKRSVQTDVWSVGVVLYQLLNGTLPFPQEHPSERLFAVLTKNFEPLDPGIPVDLRRVVEKALQKQPENRYSSAAEMREALTTATNRSSSPTTMATEVIDASKMASMATIYTAEPTPPDETRLVGVAGLHTPDTHAQADSVATRVEIAIPKQASPKVDGAEFVSGMSMGKMALVAAGLIFIAFIVSVIIAGLSQGRPSTANSIYPNSNNSKSANSTNMTNASAANAANAAANAAASAANSLTSNRSASNTESARSPFCRGYIEEWTRGYKDQLGRVPGYIPTCPNESDYKDKTYEGGKITGYYQGMTYAQSLSKSNANK